MRTTLFVVGVLVGAVIGTAWAQIPVSQGLGSPARVATIDPTDMMANTAPLPVENYDAF